MPFKPGDLVTPIEITDWHEEWGITKNSIGVVVNYTPGVVLTVQYPSINKPRRVKETNTQHADPTICGIRHRAKLAEKHNYLTLD